MSVRRIVAALPVVLAAGVASARPVESTDGLDAGPVLRHAKARLVGATVHIDVRFDVVVDVLPAPGVSQTVTLPHGAVITGGSVLASGQSHRLQLLEREEANKRVEILHEPPTASGGRMWAVRVDADSDAATIEIAAARAGTVRIDLALEVPACFAHDARYISVPQDWVDTISGGTAAPTGAEVSSVCGDADAAWLAFPTRELARRRAGEQRIGIASSRLSVIAAGASADVARIEVSLAAQLTEVPADLHTVFVVDHSRSVTADELATQRAVIDAYSRAAPHGRIQLVGYARHARTLLPGWTAASQAARRIERELRALAPRNGSNVDSGLAAAVTLLRDVRGTRRIILLTDDRLADRITSDVASLAPIVPANMLVHVVSLRGHQGLARTPGHVLEPLALATQGMATTAGLDDHGALDALALVRPISFDEVTITGPGWQSLDAERACPGDDSFREGASCVWLAEGTPASRAVVVEGYLWGTKITRELTPDKRGARSLARLLSTWTGLPDKLQDGVHAAARAVNSAWSLLATWGPRGGYGDLDSLGTFGFGSIGTSSRHTSIGVGPRSVERTPTDDLIAQLGPAVRACNATGTVSLVVELTLEEIVDVSVSFADDRDRARADCITEAVWDATLVLAAAPRHTTVSVSIAPT